MKISEFIKDFTDKKIHNSRINENAVEDYLKQTLGVKTYIPFKKKRAIVEDVVANNIAIENGIKKIDSINQYVTFVLAMIEAHTDLEIDNNEPIMDYDLLAESNLLSQIITTFQESYNECQVLLNLCVQNELEDNNVNVLVGRFLNGILTRLDSVGEVLGGMNIKDILGVNFTEKDIAALSGLLDKLK